MKDLWYPDAVGIASQEDFLKLIYRPGKIESYLKHIGDGDNTYFLIGPKGSGKTHLLLCKSYLYHHSDRGYKFNTDSNHLVEYVDFPRNSLSQDDLQKFRNPELWKNIWRLCLMIVALKSAEVELPSPLKTKIERLIGESTQIGDMLYNIFNNRKKIQLVVDLSGEILTKINQIKSGVAIFIDNVDQAFEDIIAEARNLSDDMIEAAVETWVNAQMGLVDAIYSLCTRKPHLKIFATVRLEAFRIDYPRGHNYEYHGIKLHYTKSHIQRILSNRIKTISGKANIREFLGIETMPHRYYKNPDGSIHEEDIFDFIYRHTYGRPREIIAIGETLDSLLSEHDHTKWEIEELQYRVREAVNSEATRFFERYTTEVTPYFNKLEFSNFLHSIPRNVFSQTELSKLELSNQQLEEYFNLGLLGHTQQQPGGGALLQTFRNFSQGDFGQKKNLPEADYYLIHPTLNRTLIQARDYKILDEQYLIGPDLPFYPGKSEIPIYIDQVNVGFPDLSFFMPLNIVNNNERLVKPGAKHSDPLKSYYECYYHRRSDILEMIIRSMKSEFEESFNKLVKCKLSQELYNNRNKENYIAVCNQTQVELRRAFPRKRVYQVHLPPVEKDLDSARSLFKHRLYGRLIVLGCCLFLRMDCRKIHALLTNDNELIFKDSESESTNGNTEYRYLQTAFFIHGLSEYKKSGTYEEVLTEIYENLSSYEKSLIKEWRNHTLPKMVDKIPWIQEGDRTWVSEEWISGIWKPN